MRGWEFRLSLVDQRQRFSPEFWIHPFSYSQSQAVGLVQQDIHIFSGQAGNILNSIQEFNCITKSRILLQKYYIKLSVDFFQMIQVHLNLAVMYFYTTQKIMRETQIAMRKYVKLQVGIRYLQNCIEVLTKSHLSPIACLQ